MRRCTRTVALVIQALGLLGWEAHAQPVALLRGPYLQAAGPTQMIVRWRTSAATTGRVQAGTTAAMLPMVADETRATTEHAVALTHLLPGTRYFYKVGSPDGAVAWGDDSFSFVTPQEAGTPLPTRLWVLGDSGTGNADAARVRDAFLAFNEDHPLDVWLMLGDNAYPHGTDEQYQQALFDFFPALLRGHGLWSAIGNADILCCEGAVATAPYLHIFSPPVAGETGGVGSGSVLYYSFDHGDIHLVVLDSMVSDRSPDGPMLTWLRQDLEANHSAWLIAAFHHPPYTAGEHDSDFEQDLVQMRRNVLPILEEHGVDLVLGGHSHGYERSFLLDGHYGTSDTLTAAMKKDPGKGRPEEGGPYRKAPGPHQGAVYVVAGNGGQVTPGPLNHPAMAVSEMALGSLVVDIDGAELRATFLRDTGVIDDHFTIIKPHLPPPPGCDGPCALDASAPGEGADAAAAAGGADAARGDAGGGADGGGCGCALGGRARSTEVVVLMVLGLWRWRSRKRGTR
jgi:hypothetical protein